MTKAAVYFGSHHIYDDIVSASKSLLVNSDVEKIYLLIEDDAFPYPLPDIYEVRNIRELVPKIFDKNGPNFNTKWTYIGLIRAALSKVFPDLDRILSIDCDTIVTQDISDLWELPLDDYYFAAAKEPLLSKYRHELYINAGVMMLNLKKIRNDRKDDQYIHELDSQKLVFVAQDAMSKHSQNHILEIPSDYNACDYTLYTDNKKVIHYAGKSDWRDRDIVKKYRDMPWSEIRGGLCVT